MPKYYVLDSVHVMLYFCTFSRLTVWLWTTKWSSPGRSISPIPTLAQLPAVICVELSLMGLSQCSLACSLLPCLSCWCLDCHIGENLHDLTAKSQMFWPIQSFCLLFRNVPWGLGVGSFVDIYYWDWYSHLISYWLWFYVIVLSIAKSSVLDQGESYNHL